MIVGVAFTCEMLLVKLVTLLLAVELVKVTTAPPVPPAAALPQSAEVPDVKVPPAASLRFLAVLTAAAVVLTAIL
jgi:hypothetical protein